MRPSHLLCLLHRVLVRTAAPLSGASTPTRPGRVERGQGLFRPVEGAGHLRAGRLAVRGLLGCLLGGLLLGAPLRAAELRVAVAANFTAPMQQLARRFEQETGHTLRLAFGSTGGLAAQIRNGAPYEVLLAADAQTPRLLAQQGWAVPASIFTYATGTLVLWSAQPGLVDAQGALLHQRERMASQRLALADPRLSPYGAAAVETLRALGLLAALQPRLVQGENMAQTYQFVASGNATLGFVAWSQVSAQGQLLRGSAWVVPAQLHAPLRHDAVLLQAGRKVPAAQALMDFLRSAPARALMRNHGYST